MLGLSMYEKLAILCESPVFRSLDDDARRVFAEMAETECFQADGIVCNCGEFDDRVMVVVSGSLSVSLPGVGKGVSVLGRGEIIGEYGLVVGLRRTANVVALERTVLLSVDYERFTAFLQRYPGVLIYLFSKAVTRLLQLEAQVREHSVAGE